MAGNSPTFLGHRLWEETRVALFKQAVDDRERGLAALLERYLEHQRTGEPVHTWPVPDAGRPTKGEP